MVLTGLFLTMCIHYSCRKDNDGPGPGIIPLPDIEERVSEIVGTKGGLYEYKDSYHYDDGRLSEYYVYRYDHKGEWVEWLKYTFEYPSDDMIIEYRQGISDSNYFFTHKYDRKYEGDELHEMIFYNRDEAFENHWKPAKKIEWHYDQDRIVEKITYKYQEGNWEEYTRAVYEYTGHLWTGVYYYGSAYGTWDTIACSILLYEDEILTEVDAYECRFPGGWTRNEQHLLHYEGALLSRLVINEASGDSLIWDQTISIAYNEKGHPVLYTVEYPCCPTEAIQVIYEEGRGNFQRATQEFSSYMIWPWLPAPVR